MNYNGSILILIWIKYPMHPYNKDKNFKKVLIEIIIKK